MADLKDRRNVGPNPRISFRWRNFRWSCPVWNSATQSLRDKILAVQDRASCLPESLRRALVADAREIRQHQMHPSSPL